MAVEYIEYATKVGGDKWTSREANDVKNVVNNNANELLALKGNVTTIGGAITQMSQEVEELKDGGIPQTSQTSTEMTISPNRLYVWGSVPSLAITLANAVSGKMNEYMLQFVPSSSTFTLTFSTAVTWMEDPEWEQGVTYQVSVQNGLAIAAPFRPAE